MFSRFIQILLVLSSISPILLTFWFKYFSEEWNIKDGWYFILISLILIVLLLIFLNMAKKSLEKIQINIIEIKTADHENIIFIFTYLIPLLNVNISMTLFLLILASLIIYNSNLYHFNPLLGFLHYHQYEIKLENGTTFILITRKQLINSKKVKVAVQLTNYILLEKE